MPGTYTIPALVQALVDHSRRRRPRPRRPRIQRSGRRPPHDRDPPRKPRSEAPARGSAGRRRCARSCARRASLPEQLVYPLFVIEGEGQRRPVSSMPGVFQLSVDEAVREASGVKADGIGGVILFGLPSSKDASGPAASDPDAPVQSAARIKREVRDLRRDDRRLPVRIHVARALRVLVEDRATGRSRSPTMRRSSILRRRRCRTRSRAPTSSRHPT